MVHGNLIYLITPKMLDILPSRARSTKGHCVCSTVAAAGRDEGKLRRIIDSLGVERKPAIVVADVDNDAQMLHMAASGK